MRRIIFLAALLAGCGHHGPLLVARPAHPAAIVAFHDVAVLDVEHGTREEHRDVIVRDGKIAAIGATGAPLPAGAKILEGAGLTLLPGLIDAHGHLDNGTAPPWKSELPDSNATMRSFLYCGVTTVFDPADLDTKAFARREKVRAGKLIGPHIFAAGPAFTAPGGHPAAMLTALLPWFARGYAVRHFTRGVANAKDATAAVDALAKQHPDFIKIVVDRIPLTAPRISEEALNATVAAAKANGLRAVAHIGSTDDALAAARAGVAAWIHGVESERIPDDQIAPLAAFHIPMAPTMVVFENYALLGTGPRQSTPLEREVASPALLAAFDNPPTDTPPARLFRSYLLLLREHRLDWRDNVRRLRAAGVTILAGSDAQPGVFPGPGLHRELHLLTEAGLTPAEAIRAATIDNAKFLAGTAEPSFGVVAEGKRADLLLVEGDPTADLDALAKIRAVMLDGVMLQRHPHGR